MSYRDEEGAKVARIDALEDQVDELRAENERLKAAAAAPKAEPAPSKAERKLLKKGAAPSGGSQPAESRLMATERAQRRFRVFAALGVTVALL